MIISGITVLAFLVLHFIDFWIPEISTKYLVGDMSGLMNDGDIDTIMSYTKSLMPFQE